MIKMRRLFLNIVSFAFLAVVFSTAYTAQAQVRAYRVSDRQVKTLINRIETRTDTFRNQLNRSLDRSSLNGTSSEDAVNSYVAGFESATDRLRSRFDARQSAATDVEEVLNRANFINAFMFQNRLDSSVQTQWVLVRNDLNLLASYYNIRWDWTTTIPMTSSNPIETSIPYTVSDVQLRGLLKRIEQRADIFKQSVNRSLDQSTLNNTNSEDSINRYITDFETATDRLRQKFESHQSVDADAQEVLTRAQVIDGFMRDQRLGYRPTSQWNLLRTDLSTLATYYGVSWNWNSPVTNQNNQFTAMLTGTYQLNNSQSDNVSNIIDSSLRTTGNVTTDQNDRMRRSLERRLTPPEMLAIENRNNQVTIASNLSPQVTFAADGVKRTETSPNGRTVSVRATTLSSGVEVSYEGDRTNDFYLTFMPMNNGQLRVTRRLYLMDRNQTVTVNSVYDRISQTADFSKVNSSNTAQYNPNYPSSTTSGVSSNDFVVPNGTQVVAVLNSTLSTSTMKDGDRFTMQVNSPSQFSGAVIEGYVSNVQRSGRISGRAETTFNFETIQLSNGNRYRFSGIIDQVRQSNGDIVSVNNEGAVRDSSQTNRTITRSGIGAALGAIIGAITGGGSGAAIGAGVGAGAGAGTVILQGRDNLELRTGAEFRITSSAPGNLRSN